MKPCAIFYHGLFHVGEPPRLLPNAGCIMANHIVEMINSGLWVAASEIHFGINGGVESESTVKAIIPEKAKVTYHGLKSCNENLSVEMLIQWAKTHPGWNVLYAHAKSSTHDPNSDYYKRVSAPWRDAMCQDLIVNWRQCVTDLETHDIACMVWLWNQGWDQSQHIPAGNFTWITSDFAAQLPSLYLRTRIKEDGIGAASARYESEVAWGNGPRPKVKAYRDRLPF